MDHQKDALITALRNEVAAYPERKEKYWISAEHFLLAELLNLGEVRRKNHQDKDYDDTYQSELEFEGNIFVCVSSTPL